VVAWAVLVVLVAGCPTAPPVPAPEQSSTIDPGTLPELGDYMPPLDDERIEVAPPEGWYIPSASLKYIVRFQLDTQTKYPSIIVTGEDYEPIFNVSEDNVKAFAAQVKRDQEVPAVKPIEVGQFIGVTYRKQAKEKQSINKILERLFLDTVVAGRKYTIELRTREGSLAEAQPHLFAVAHGIKFLKAEPPGEEAGPGEPAGEVQEGPEKEPPETPKEEPKEGPKAEPEDEPKGTPKEGPKEEPKEDSKKEPEKKDDGLDTELKGLDELLE
jgi:hypothetical protein